MFFDEVYKYFVGTFIIGCGFFISFKLVDKFVYQPMLLEGELSDDELSEEELKERRGAIFYKLFKEYADLEYADLSSDDFKDFLGVLIEDTPLGVVKMYYSQEDESFIYWSEKQVPYKVLETVSRKYVIDYNCKSIHINMDEELEKQRQLLMDAKNETENKDNKEDDETGDKAKSSVFANFKKYNTEDPKLLKIKLATGQKLKM